MVQVRRSILSGTWYPGEPEKLREDVDGFLEQASRAGDGRRPIALIAPHAGYAYSGPTAGQAYAGLSHQEYDRVFVLAPSHRHGFRGASMLEVDAYETPLGAVPLVHAGEREAIRRAGGLLEESAAHAEEHSLEIQLPFLQVALAPDWRLVPIVVGQLSGHESQTLGHGLRRFFDSRTLVVASSDFTHHGASFGFEPFDPDEELFENLARLDGGAVERILDRDPVGLMRYRRETGITACGIVPMVVMLCMLPTDARGRDVGYATSGLLTGDRSRSVSYRAVTFHQEFPELDLSASLEERLLRLAREEIGRAASDQPSLPASQAGVNEETVVDAFVTLWRRENRKLRGCIGSVGSPRPIGEAVRGAARGAAQRDPRFSPLEPEEVNQVAIEISILTPPQPIAPEDVQVGKHGLGLTHPDGRGVYLPKVAVEMGWDRQAYLDGICQKARLSPGAHLDPGAELHAFEALSFAEERNSFDRDPEPA